MRTLCTVAIFVLSTLVLASCGVPTDDKPRAIPTERVPFDLLAPSTTSSTTTAQVQTVEVDAYMLRNNRLTSVKRMVAAPPTVGVVLAALLQGPNDTESSAGFRSAVSAQAGVVGAQVNGSTAIVNITPAFLALPREEQINALAQIVYTATDLPNVSAVQAEVDSKPTEIPKGDGTLTRDSLNRAAYAKLAP